jgi:hypothetical protein
MEELKQCTHDSYHGGVSTCHDPYGVRAKVGLPSYPWVFYCWDCWEAFGREVDKRIAEETAAAIQSAGWCGFTEAWIGPCQNPRPCSKHSREKCWKCGEPATRNCSYTGTLVCGVPECGKHPHEHR